MRRRVKSKDLDEANNKVNEEKSNYIPNSISERSLTMAKWVVGDVSHLFKDRHTLTCLLIAIFIVIYLGFFFDQEGIDDTKKVQIGFFACAISFIAYGVVTVYFLLQNQNIYIIIDPRWISNSSTSCSVENKSLYNAYYI